VQGRGKGGVTLLGPILSNATIVVMDEPPDGPNGVLELLRERQGLSHQAGTPVALTCCSNARCNSSGRCLCPPPHAG